MNIRVANKITGDGNSIFRNITAGNVLNKVKYFFTGLFIFLKGQKTQEASGFSLKVCWIVKK